MRVGKVIHDILTSKKAASEFKAKAEAASTAGQGSDEWTDFMRLFAENADELARLKVPGKMVNGKRIHTTITTLFLTRHTAATTFTAVTTTTSNLCGRSTLCPPPGKAGTRKGK